MATKTNDDDARRDASADATRAPAALSYGSVFTHAKAGMENVDRERVLLAGPRVGASTM